MSYRDNGYVSRVGYSQQFSAGGAGIVVDPHWDNLLAGYLMDETNDLNNYQDRADVQGVYTLTDVEGDGNGGVGGTPSDTGVNGNAANVYAPGSSDARFLRQTSGPSVAGGDLFMAFWLKCGALPGRIQLYSSYTSPTENFSSSMFQSGPFYYLRFTYNGQPATDTTQWTSRGGTTAFQLIYAWFDSADGYVRMQINNGSIFTSAGTTTAISGTLQKFLVGYDNYVSEQNSYFDGLYLFNEIKDTDWRTAHYNGGAGRVWPL